MAKASKKKGAPAPATEALNTEGTPNATEAAPKAEKAAKPEKAKRPPAVVQNGVTRPRAGGLCAAVWEITESLLSRNDSTGEADMPTIAEVKAKAAEQGLNPTNVSIEYYRCRQFHGVRGRQRKAEPEQPQA